MKTVADNIAGRTICAFGEACAWPTQSFVEKFREEFEAKASKPSPPPLPPEYTSGELINEDDGIIDTSPSPTIPAGKKPARREQFEESWKLRSQESNAE